MTPTPIKAMSWLTDKRVWMAAIVLAILGTLTYYEYRNEIISKEKQLLEQELQSRKDEIEEKKKYLKVKEEEIELLKRQNEGMMIRNKEIEERYTAENKLLMSLLEQERQYKDSAIPESIANVLNKPRNLSEAVEDKEKRKPSPLLSHPFDPNRSVIDPMYMDRKLN
jgi:hypothetical protein|nr:MAG TPA: hypothetical protein [Caudoviricetes sp.]